MGQAPPGSAYNDEGEGWPLIAGAGDFDRGRLSPKKHTSKASRVSTSGDIVLAIRASIGERVWSDGEYCLGRGVAALRPKHDLYAGYLWHWLGHVRPLLESRGRGATFRQVNREDIASLELSLPPIEEQRRIAGVLDHADELRAARRAALVKLEMLKQSIFLDMFGTYWANPKEHDKSSLGDAATFVGGGTPSRAVPSYFEGSICWATSKDMKHEYLDDTQEHITALAIERSATNLVPAGSILIVVKSKVLAHSLPLAIARVSTCFGQDIKAIRVSADWDVHFVAWALRVHREWLLGKARGINTEGLTLEHLRSFPLLKPPLDIQKEFSDRIEKVDSLIRSQAKSSAQMEELSDVLSERAFAGAL